jgi:hypothetical protein
LRLPSRSQVESEVNSMRAFFHVWRNCETGEDHFEAVQVNNAQWAQLEEAQAFFETATVGDVFELQYGEYIIALGTLIRASWLR